MKLVDAYVFLKRLRDLLYSLLELRDRMEELGFEIVAVREAVPLVKYGFI